MITLIQTPTNNLNKSLEFYKKLNFKPILSEYPNIFTDAKVFIEINPDRYARLGIKFLNDSWESVINKLNKTNSVIKIDSGYMVQDNNGIYIYLIEDKANINIDKEGVSTSILGNFAGLSIETLSIKDSIKFYQILGFNVVAGDENSSWVSMTNENITISFMLVNTCPHLFINPSLTYFNGKKNLDIINSIRQLKINFAEEITHFNEEGLVDNVIINDPGGLGFFIFND